jgi:hypothetical protein
VQYLTHLRQLALALAFVGLAGCNAGYQEISLAQLARQQDAYDGRLVETAGVLRSHDAPRHYWIADSHDHRVELLTEQDLSVSVGQRLAVRGRFLYAPDRGRRIEVESLSPAQAALPPN